MLVTTHSLTGAVIGAALRHRPAVAFAAGVASHLVLDSLPHWGAGHDRRRYLEVARRDGVTALATISAVLVAAPRPARAGVAAGIAGAVLPDVRAPAQHFLQVQPIPRPLDRVHTRVQQGRESRRRLPQEVVVGALAAAVCGVAVGVLRRRHRAASRHRPPGAPAERSSE